MFRFELGPQPSVCMSSTHVHVTARGEDVTGWLKALISPSQLLREFLNGGHRARKIATLRYVPPPSNSERDSLPSSLFPVEDTPLKEAVVVVVIDGNLIFGGGIGQFAAREEEGIEFEEFWGRNEIKSPSPPLVTRIERAGNRDFEESVEKSNLIVN